MCFEEWQDKTQFREWVIGRCRDYQAQYNPGPFCEHRQKNCTELFETFVSSFRFNPEWNLTHDNFKPFVDAAEMKIPRNKGILWEGVYPFISRYTNDGSKYLALADTLMGRMLDASWTMYCGSRETDDGWAIGPVCWENRTFGWESEGSAVWAMWSGSSAKYATLLSGEVPFLINASTTPAFKNNTFFARFELPNMSLSKVTGFHIKLIHALGQPVNETCKSPSIQKLMGLLDDRGFRHTCAENPRDVVMLMCSDNPSHPDCSAFYQMPTGSGGVVAAGLILTLIAVVLAIVTLIPV
ncbi:hypothetical protein ScPMuIL_017763 [Solemya velum]